VSRIAATGATSFEAIVILEEATTAAADWRVAGATPALTHDRPTAYTLRMGGRRRIERTDNHQMEGRISVKIEGLTLPSAA